MFRGGRSVKLLKIAGIRIGVDATWFFMLFLLIFLLSGSFQSALDSSGNVAFLTTVATVLLFFGSLIVHELGHAFAARRHGIQVDRIELFLFGGTTFMSRDSETPGEEFKIAIAGPLGTLLVALVCFGLDVALIGVNQIIPAARLDSSIHITPVVLALSWLLPMNVMILIFNLVPAYPLDGGRLARAVVWKYTGDQLRGTRASAQLGRGFAILLGGFGLLVMMSGSSFAGIWLMVLAFMIHQSAIGALRGTEVTRRVQKVLVADIMDHEPVYVPSPTPVAQARDDYFLRYGAAWLPVVDAGGRFIGISRRYRVEEAAESSDPGATVASVLETDETENLRVGEDQPLTEVLTRRALNEMGAVVAVDSNGILRGVVTLDQVRRALQNVLSTPLHT